MPTSGRRFVTALALIIKVLIVPTPPEIAAAFNIAPELTGVPSGMTGWDAWRDTHDHGRVRPGGCHRCSIRRAPPDGPRACGAGRCGPEQLAAAERVSTLAYGIAPNDDQVVLMNGPMYHSAPNSYGMLAFRHGCTIVLEPRFDPEDLLRLVQQYRISHMHAVPTMFVRLLRLPEEVRKRYDVSSLRFVIHGAAPCPVEVKRAMIEWWGPVINEYLGSTETGIPVWHSSAEALAKPGTVGRAIEGGIVKIFRPDGTLCDVDEPGEIFMRQTAIADFDYHGNAAARAEAGRDGLSASATSAISTRTAICSCATASATW